MKKYGESSTESSLKKRQQCRDIVKTIIEFGVNEDQKIRIIKLLSMETENREFMKKIFEICQKYLQNEKLDKNKIIEVE